jgi:hypothetical protein
MEKDPLANEFGRLSLDGRRKEGKGKARPDKTTQIKHISSSFVMAKDPRSLINLDKTRTRIALLNDCLITADQARIIVTSAKITQKTNTSEVSESLTDKPLLLINTPRNKPSLKMDKNESESKTSKRRIVISFGNSNEKIVINDGKNSYQGSNASNVPSSSKQETPLQDEREELSNNVPSSSKKQTPLQDEREELSNNDPSSSKKQTPLQDERKSSILSWRPTVMPIQKTPENKRNNKSDYPRSGFR